MKLNLGTKLASLNSLEKGVDSNMAKNVYSSETGMGGLEGFYPLAVLAAVKFTVTCDTCEDPTSNPQYWRTAAKTIYDESPTKAELLFIHVIW